MTSSGAQTRAARARDDFRPRSGYSSETLPPTSPISSALPPVASILPPGSKLKKTPTQTQNLGGFCPILGNAIFAPLFFLNFWPGGIAPGPARRAPLLLSIIGSSLWKYLSSF